MSSVVDELEVDDSPKLIPRFTEQGYSVEDVQRRRSWIEDRSRTSLSHVGAQGRVTMGVWWKLADASELPTHVFTWGGNEKAYAWMMRFTDHDTSNPIDAWSSQGSNSSTPTSPAVSSTVGQAMILRLGGFDKDGITEDDPGVGGYGLITMDSSGSGNGNVSGGGAYGTQPTAGDSGALSFQLTSGNRSVAVTVAIAPVSP